jgi:hypothetical protein
MLSATEIETNLVWFCQYLPLFAISPPLTVADWAGLRCGLLAPLRKMSSSAGGASSCVLAAMNLFSSSRAAAVGCTLGWTRCGRGLVGSDGMACTSVSGAIGFQSARE